jgi:hypothetical protein
MKKQTIAPGMVVYNDLVEDSMEYIREIEEFFAKYNDGWVKATINDNQYDPELRSCHVFSLAKREKEAVDLKGQDWYDEVLKFQSKLNRITMEAVFDYHNSFGIAAKEKEHWEVLRYQETQKLVWHSDDGDSHPCRVSYVYYFNDDYEGGDIEFRHFLTEPYKPKKGDLIIFPSNYIYVHRVLPVTSGTKYAAISFSK